MRPGIVSLRDAGAWGQFLEPESEFHFVTSFCNVISKW